MATQIITSKYQSAHSKAPRGFGTWAFITRAGEIALWYTGSYAEAKKVAQKSVYTTLYVGS